MRVLLDEQLPHRLRTLLGTVEVFTVDYMGWAGLKNGELLTVAENHGFDAVLTGDKNLAYQQNMAGRRIAVVTLSAIDFNVLQANLSLIAAAISSASPGASLQVDCTAVAPKIR